MSIRNERAKRWVFTINNYNPDGIDAQMAVMSEVLDTRYLVYGREVGEQGTPHIQGYFRLAKGMYRSSIKHLFIANTGFYPYLSVARGTELDNFRYCTKEGKYIEIGEKVAEAEKQVARDERVKLVMKDWLSLPRDEFNDKWPYESLHWRNKLTTWEAQVTMSSNTWSGFLKAKNFWIWGPPGTGKSRWARRQAPEIAVYPKGCNKWWGGFDSRIHRIVLFEDFPRDGKYLGQLMKIWADRYSFTAEIKGGSQKVNPGTFVLVVTSNYRIAEIFGSNDEDGAALLRRFNEIEVKTDHDLFLSTDIEWDQINLEKV